METKKRKVEDLIPDDGIPEHEAQCRREDFAPADSLATTEPGPTSSEESVVSAAGAQTPSQGFSVVPGSGFSAYAKINPFAIATAGGKSSSFGFNITTTPLEGLRPNFTMPAPLTVPSPKSPKANPFSSPSPAHNPFMTIVESKDELWQAMAKDKLSDEEAAKTSLFEGPHKKPRTAKFGSGGFGDSTGDSASDVAPTNFSADGSKSLFARSDNDDAEEDNECGGEEDDGAESPQAVFTTYALPENAVVVTGEEGESCSMQVRVKLFRLNYKNKPAQGSASGSGDGLKSFLALGPRSADTDHGLSLSVQETPSLDVADTPRPSVVQKEQEMKSPAASSDAPVTDAPDISAAEWVEVGIGPLKILQSVASASEKSSAEDEAPAQKFLYRIVMRREEKKGGLGTKLLLNIRLDHRAAVVPASDKTLRLLGVTFNEDASSSIGTFLIKTKTAQECVSLLGLIKEGLACQNA